MTGPTFQPDDKRVFSFQNIFFHLTLRRSQDDARMDDNSGGGTKDPVSIRCAARLVPWLKPLNRFQGGGGLCAGFHRRG